MDAKTLFNSPSSNIFPVLQGAAKNATRQLQFITFTDEDEKFLCYEVSALADIALVRDGVIPHGRMPRVTLQFVDGTTLDISMSVWATLEIDIGLETVLPYFLLLDRTDLIRLFDVLELCADDIQACAIWGRLAEALDVKEVQYPIRVPRAGAYALRLAEVVATLSWPEDADMHYRLQVAHDDGFSEVTHARGQSPVAVSAHQDEAYAFLATLLHRIRLHQEYHENLRKAISDVVSNL